MLLLRWKLPAEDFAHVWTAACEVDAAAKIAADKAASLKNFIEYDFRCCNMPNGTCNSAHGTNALSNIRTCNEEVSD